MVRYSQREKTFVRSKLEKRLEVKEGREKVDCFVTIPTFDCIVKKVEFHRDLTLFAIKMIESLMLGSFHRERVCHMTMTKNQISVKLKKIFIVDLWH